MTINLNQMAEEIQTGQRAINNNSVLIYGPPKTGKTLLTSTVAAIPSIKKVIWFDTEQGISTLFSPASKLTAQEKAKIVPILFQDTRDNPLAAETLLKTLTSSTPTHIEQETGKFKKFKTDQTISLYYGDLTASTAVVFDTISQVGDSVFNLQLKFNSFKDNRKYWGLFYQDMNAIMSCIQSSKAINILTAQEQIKEGTKAEEGKTRTIQKSANQSKTSAIMVQDDKLIPVCGSMAYSLKIGKYVGSLIRLYIENKERSYLSSPTLMANVLAGSRLDIDLSQIPNPTMADILGVRK